MGMKRDMQQRESLARVDDEARRRKVDTAREIIYRKNFAINNRAVKTLLQEHSLVPTSVSLIVIHATDLDADIGCRTHFLADLLRSDSTCFPCLL
jgi:hypothetical protein